MKMCRYRSTFLEGISLYMDRAIEVDPHAQATNLTNACDRCGKRLRGGWGFAFKSKPGAAAQATDTVVAALTKCTSCAIRHAPMLRRSLAVALVVGTMLTLLNQGDTILAGKWPDALYWKIPLTYCVPFCVATYGALSISRR